MKHMGMPWYVPIMATLAVVLMAVSLWQRPGVLRTVGVLIFALLCASEWVFFGAETRIPDYTGPAQPGNKIPAFTTALADGTPFTQKDLENGQKTVLLFFRGRW